MALLAGGLADVALGYWLFIALCRRPAA